MTSEEAPTERSETVVVHIFRTKQKGWFETIY